MDPAVTGRAATVYPFLYLNNGSNRLVRSEHDNTQVVRWVLRAHGVALDGPPVRQFVDPVRPGYLVAEIRALMRWFVGMLLDGSTKIDALWFQGFTVLFFCRVLQSLATATVTSKPEAMRWARLNLDPPWGPLIDRAWQQRSRYPRGHGAPEAHTALAPPPDDVALTLEFVRYALELDARTSDG